MTPDPRIAAAQYLKWIGRDPSKTFYRCFKDKHFDYSKEGMPVPQPRTMRTGLELLEAAEGKAGIYYSIAKLPPTLNGSKDATKAGLVNEGATWDCFIAEWDDGSSLGEQLEQIQEAGLPSPSYHIETGGKSNHFYWMLDEELDLETWEEIQGGQVLKALPQSDQKIKDGSRVMRLPGFGHIYGGGIVTLKADISQEPARYSVDEFRGLVEAEDPSPTVPQAPPANGSKWFDMLPQASQEDAIVDMLRFISAEHGNSSEGGYVGNDVQERFIFGLLSWAGSMTDEALIALIERAFPWNSHSHKLGDGSFRSWRISCLKGCVAKRQSIGSLITFARECGWDSKKWKRQVGTDDASMALLVLYDCFGLTDERMDDMLTVNGATYRKDAAGTHFNRIPDSELAHTISRFIQREHPSKFGNVETVIKALKQNTSWPALVSPDGYINCTNGVLKVTSQNVELFAHDSEEVFGFVFLDPPGCAYDPGASVDHALKILDGFDDEPEAAETFLRIISQGLNATEAQRITSPVNAFIYGSGGNGKDVLRLALTMIFGRNTVAGVDLSDLAKASDSGQNNGTLALMALRHARLNMPSETSTAMLLNRLATMKAALSGDEIKARGHNQEYVYFSPRCPHIFPINDPIIFQGTDALDRRIRILQMPYVFKFGHDYDPNNELHREADPRYKPHPSDQEGMEWLQQEVLPGLLNELIRAWKGFSGAEATPWGPGIPRAYSDAVTRSMREDNDEVLQWLDEAGWVECSDQWNTTSPLMSQLWDDFNRWNLQHGGGSDIRNAKQLERRLVGCTKAKVVKPNAASASQYGITRARRLTNLRRKGL